jgi:hypothetical protein
MSIYIEELLLADEYAYEDGRLCWVSREMHPRKEEAADYAVRQLADRDVTRDLIRLIPVLLRLESEVEANINGHECPYWVECTTRAKHPLPYWRVEFVPQSKEPSKPNENP